MGELLDRFELQPLRLWPTGAIGVQQHRGEGGTLLRGDDDEAPGRQLSVIGRAAGKGAHVLQLRLARPGRGEIARLARAAGG